MSMEFLVRIKVDIPPSTEAAEIQQLTHLERIRGRELQEAGVIQRIWRIPGTTGNVGIWRAQDATDLHSALASLPLFKFMRIEVTALAVHPLEIGTEK